jgi:2-dehydropantoate 2-reductase
VKVAVVGPGAIGAAFGAAAVEAGHDVLLCGRTPVERIDVEYENGSPTVTLGPVRTQPQPADVDWVLLAVKAHQTAGAAGWLRALCDGGTKLAALQNGVEQREWSAAYANGATIVPTIVWAPVEPIGRGHMKVRGPTALTVADNQPGQALAALLAGSAAEVTLSDDFVTELWRKLIANAVAGLMVLAGRRAGIFRRADVASLAVRLAVECAAVARAEGASLDDGDAAAIVDRLAALPADSGTSMLFDREAGRPLEWDARNGVVQRFGRRHGIATPVSDVIVPLLAAASPAE